MASRRETRLPQAGNPLADAEVQLSDPQTGKFDDGELVKFFTQQESTTGQAVAGPLHPCNVIETDYSLESCLPSYQARKEAAETRNAPSFQGLFKRLKKALSDEDRQTEELAREPDPVNDDLGDPTKLAIHKTWPPDYRKSASEHLAEAQFEAKPHFGKLRPRPRPSQPDDTDESEGDNVFITLSASRTVNRTPASAPHAVNSQTPASLALPRYQLDGTDECALDEAQIDPGLRQQISPPTRPVQFRPAQVTQQSSPASKPFQLAGSSNGSGNFSPTPSPSLPSARTTDFENHTRNERGLSRTSTHEVSDNNEESAFTGLSPNARKQPSASTTPSAQTGMDLSRLISLLGPESSSKWSTSGHRPSPLHESSASREVIASTKTSTGASAREKSLKIDEETTISIHNSSTANKCRSYLQNHVHAGRLTPLNYGELVPEVLPPGYTNITYLRSTEEKRNKMLQHLAYRLSSLRADDVEHLVQSDYLQTVLEVAKTAWPMFPRVFSPQPFKKSLKAPPICRPRSSADSWPDSIPVDLLEYLATNYLSHADLRNLRLVNKPMSEAFSPIYFRRLVTPFGLGMFAPSQRHGDSVNQFGISFEIDLPALYNSKYKVSQEMQQSWWGDYTWPKPAYQRFPELKALEDLVDENTPLLKEALQNLPNASELALSIDSGHGWLNGPDLSDTQLWDIRHNGSKVFGKKFKAADKWEEHLRNEVFRWAQQNTINQSIKYLVERSTIENSASFSRTKSKLRWLQSVRVRDYKSFEAVSGQTDNDPNQHTGGTRDPPPPGYGQAAQNQLGTVLANAMGHIPGNNNPPPAPSLGQTAPATTGAWQAQLQLQQIVPPGNGNVSGVPRAAAPRHRSAGRRIQPGRARPHSPKRTRGVHLPQWPLIFNGYNLSAEVGGQNTYVQAKTAKPTDSRIQPGQLSEAQAQWLMETFWAQRAFLSAYTTSVILNKPNLGKVHALNIAKLSSGLLPTLEQHEFWRALPGLRNLTIMISPDWRQEHIPGDQSFQSNMLISPVNTSIKLTSFLQHFICNLENLSELTVGFVGGGEHAPGMLARNQHVLPAPITQEPRLWLSDHHTTPPAQSMISFNHIEKLKFSNCWFSPCMVLAFMEKSRDTSLRHLTLDSVSLTAHGASSVGSNGIATPIQAQYGREGWLNEMPPNKGCWPAVLDEMTPGMTFLEQKKALGFHLDETSQQFLRDKSFRGNVQKITLESCGYVHISAAMVEELNQSELLRVQSGSLDDGLFARKQALQTGQSSPRSRRLLATNPGNVNVPAISVIDETPGTPQDISGRAMMSTNDAHGHEYFGLGTLTQAVHPVEKRILEQAWGMRFGWGDDMRRWSAVDDGVYEGGTGRFSGTILK